MMSSLLGVYLYNKSTLDNWNNDQKGVYYIGVQSDTNSIIPYYVGKGCGTNGIRSRLCDHLGRWDDATHFAYVVGTSDVEIEAFELSEIKRLRPKYNVQGI